MTHLNEKELTARALGYGHEKLERHLAACFQCRAKLQDLEALLELTAALPAPEPGADYAERLWAGLSPRLEEPPRQAHAPFWRRQIWTLAPALAILLLVVWMARPHRAASPTVPTATEGAAVPSPSPVLLLAVTQHLDRTQALLVELAHADAPAPGQQRAARELLASNRLYQQGASASGDTAISSLLGTIEPTLIELAHTPSQVSPTAWRQMQARIAASGLLFKVRVVDQTLQARVAAQSQAVEDGTL